HAAGPDVERPMVGRALAVGDVDNDGEQEILITDVEGPPRLLRRQRPVGASWLGVRLIGTRSNRDGIGAEVTLLAARGQRIATARTAGSYMAASDGRTHLGVGELGPVEELRARWPSGAVDVWPRPPLNQYVAIVEGSRPAARP